MLFRVWPFRLTYEASEKVRFPRLAANSIRGGLGRILAAGHKPPHEAPAYAQLFSPRWPEGPRRFQDAPRPFVLRASHLNGLAIAPGDRFVFDIYWFRRMEPFFALFAGAMSELGAIGMIHQGAGFAQLHSIEQLDPGGNPSGCVWAPGTAAADLLPVSVNLAGAGADISRICVSFETPTELKIERQSTPPRNFQHLFTNIRNRLSALGARYGDGPLSVDFHAQTQRATLIETVRENLRHQSCQRRSHGRGIRHPLGGWVGEIEFAGPLAEFIPYLEAARWAGVGKHTVWGNGQLSWRPLAAAD